MPLAILSLAKEEIDDLAEIGLHQRGTLHDLRQISDSAQFEKKNKLEIC